MTTMIKAYLTANAFRERLSAIFLKHSLILLSSTIFLAAEIGWSQPTPFNKKDELQRIISFNSKHYATFHTEQLDTIEHFFDAYFATLKQVNEEGTSTKRLQALLNRNAHTERLSHFKRYIWNDILVLQDSSKGGLGHYLISSGRKAAEYKGQPIMIQAPHQFFDRYTGQIATELSLILNQQGRPTVLAINSTHRYFAGKKPPLSDLAHQSDSLFQRVTRSFVKQFPQAPIVQLHGFSHQKRKSHQGKRAEMIISNGTLQPSRILQTALFCIKDQSEWQIFSYPNEVKELGGTRNQQGKLLRLLGHHAFLHVELSFNFRKQLLQEPQRIHIMANCL